MEFSEDVSDYEAYMEERYEPLATMADAHREWHWNTGIPIGTPGCPQDACHYPDDLHGDEEDEQAWHEAQPEYQALYFPPVDWDNPGPGYDDGIPF